MTTISSSDIVMATATFRGRTVATFCSSGFSSISEVLNAVRRSVGSVAGVIELSLRNATRGWRERRSIYIVPAA